MNFKTRRIKDVDDLKHPSAEHPWTMIILGRGRFDEDQLLVRQYNGEWWASDCDIFTDESLFEAYEELYAIG